MDICKIWREVRYIKLTGDLSENPSMLSGTVTLRYQPDLRYSAVQ